MDKKRPSDSLETHRLLMKYFVKMKSQKYGFSQRKLAQEVNVSPAFLSKMLAGKKAIPYKTLVRLCKALHIESEIVERISASHRDYLGEATVPKKGRTKIKSELSDWDFADKELFAVLRQWFYIPIYIFSQSQHFDGTAKTVASRLGIAQASVEVAMRDLLRMGLYEQVNGKYKCLEKKVRWSSDSSIEQIRKFHTEMLKKAIETLTKKTDQASFEKRLITGVMVTTSPEKILGAREKLSEFLHELANDLIVEQGSEVYHLSAQLFSIL